MHPLGLARVAAALAALALAALLVLAPPPVGVTAKGIASDTPRVTGEPVFVQAYDAATDTSLLVVRWCGYHACGPALWVEGDWRDRPLPKGSHLFEAIAGTSRAEPMAHGEPAQPKGSLYSLERAGTALAPTYRMDAAAPEFAAYAAAGVMLAGSAAAILTRERRRAWHVAGAAVAALLLSAFFLLFGALAALVAVAAGACALCALAFVGWRERRLDARWATLLLASAAFVGMVMLYGRYFPPVQFG